VAPVESETMNMCILFLGRLIGSGFTKFLFLLQEATLPSIQNPGIPQHKIPALRAVRQHYKTP